MFERLICLWKKSCDYRRAHKHEDGKLKYCKRCGGTLPVRTRKPKIASAPDNPNATRS